MAEKTSKKYNKNKDVLIHSEYVCTNLEFMANMPGGGLPSNPNRMAIKPRGKTSNDYGHIHIYYVDRNGNGIAKEVCHPDFPHICHQHPIINWVVQPGFSNNIDPSNGIPPHDHKLNLKIKKNTGQKSGTSTTTGAGRTRAGTTGGGTMGGGTGTSGY